MNADAELLDFIYQNSEMGVKTVKQLLSMTDNKPFQEHLDAELKEYSQVHEKARELLNLHGRKAKDIGALETMMAYLAIDMKTLKDKSVSHMAEMLIQGGTMGIIDCNKRIRQYEGEADKDILALMKELLKVEEDHIERLKKML